MVRQLQERQGLKTLTPHSPSGKKNFEERAEDELSRILLPRTRVIRLASDTPRAEDKCVIQHTVLYDTDLPDDP
jgi:hypothetical protein